MTEEKSIDFTDDEILMIRSMCQDTLASEPQNAVLANSILEKFSEVESSEIPIREQPTLKKRGRPRRISSEIQKEVLATPEPEPIEATSEAPVLIEEKVQEPKPLEASDNSELTKTVTEQPVINVARNPRLNFLQHLLQKFRPAVRL
jgi:hypothetical protein